MINGKLAPRSPSPPEFSSSHARKTDEPVERVVLPPPTPIKARAVIDDEHDVDEYVGETVEIDLS
jgi:hypothetical protein